MYLSKSVKTIFFVFVLFSFSSCEEEKGKVERKPYDGPLSVVNDFSAIVTDSARILYNISSNHMSELQNGDRIFKDGIYVETLDRKEKIESILESDSAYFNKKKQLWILKRDVKLFNIKSGERMFSDELFWDMKAKDSTNVYVKETTPVTIKTPTQVFTGAGLRTNQNFDDYEILNLEGVFDIEEEKESESSAKEKK